MKTIVFIGFPGVSLAAKLRIQVFIHGIDGIVPVQLVQQVIRRGALNQGIFRHGVHEVISTSYLSRAR
jgi:hypothetical protein